MKKTFFLIGLSLYFVLLSTAQNYQTVNSGRTVLFENNTQLIRALRMDSVQLNGNDSILYPFRHIQLTDESNNCYSPYAASWAGEHIIVKPDGLNLFFNQNQDTFRIETQASVGDSWIFYEEVILTVTATVSAHDTMSVLGFIDSVKTISLESSSGGHPINQMEILVSKNYGLLTIFNFYKFVEVVDFEEHVELLSLIGMDNPEVGVQNLTWFEVHDHQVGDIIQTHKEQHGPGYFLETFLSYRYLERSDYSDSIVYSVEREKLSLYHQPNAETEYIFDTITISIQNNPDFDKLSMEPRIYGNEVYETYFQMNNDLPTKGVNWWEYYYLNQDDCWIFSPGTGMCHEPTYYLKGLGGGYIYCLPNMYYTINELVYYSKGSEEWGEAIDFTTHIRTPKASFHCHIYPNPSQGILQVSIVDNNLIHQSIEVLNFQGQCIEKMSIEKANFSLQLYHLDKGIYFIRIGSQIQKFILE